MALRPFVCDKGGFVSKTQTHLDAYGNLVLIDLLILIDRRA